MRTVLLVDTNIILEYGQWILRKFCACFPETPMNSPCGIDMDILPVGIQFLIVFSWYVHILFKNIDHYAQCMYFLTDMASLSTAETERKTILALKLKIQLLTETCCTGGQQNWNSVLDILNNSTFFCAWFLYQELISYHYSSCCSCWHNTLQKSPRLHHFKWDQDEIGQDYSSHVSIDIVGFLIYSHTFKNWPCHHFRNNLKILDFKSD